ncbi:MAG TPA: putative inorganic carbon transporter subunit DabA [Candidatus Eisenbacteria bacterium]|nr:putative inorganic carbon transporter subunit DabA [Candidatus Eisenbacteria bacterium]
MLRQPISSDAGPTDDALARLIDQLAHLLPAQGPISIFIHHNTLHAFEHLGFEEAVEHAAEELQREPYLAEARYREKLASGRILAKDVTAVLDEHLGDRGAADVEGIGSRLELWQSIALHGIPPATGPELLWLLDETAALSRFRTDVPAPARAATAALRGADGASEERRSVRRLWSACIEAVRRAGELPARATATPVRHRDWLLSVEGFDIDDWIHPPLIRFLAGYLDQGLAHWVMPERNRGIHGCFLELYSTSLSAWCGSWARTLPRLVAEERRASRTPLESIAHSLAQFGVAADEHEDYLGAELLALRGWAGIVRQIEERPDRVPARDLTVTLCGYLAVRLLFERAALDEASRRLSFDGPLSDLRAWLHARRRPIPAPTAIDRAWPLFHVAQLCGLDASTVEQWTAGHVAALESELEELDDVRRRRILHQAFERTIRHRLYDALMQHEPRPPAVPPAFQAVFCIDEREESFRRHLEEAGPACETFGAAGFFNVAMYHQSVSDAHPRPLCPVAIRPTHYVAEVEPDSDRLLERSRRLQRRAAGFLGYNVDLGSRLPVHGAVLMTAFGWLALVPLVLRVVFPWLTSRWRRVHATTTAARTRLQLDREEEAPPLGKYSGFTVNEMAEIVRRVLDDIGIRDRLSPLVLVIGHGSISLNNPHESAHDCGACGGGRGGPNARAFAQMANDPRVRELLAAQGWPIPETTRFVGAQRNTCNNEVTFFDEDLITADRRPLFDRACEAIETARRREAHERCRRFDAVPGWYPPLAALAHVEGRAADLAQPRPEYGHATNAFCVIGRRARTRGLFLDRRAFLVSYDPALDSDGSTLARVMAAVVPVAAGISLEYYFSYVDPIGYGCGTKLPHNVTSLLGVMDGAQSDLRTGLPWQMVEIHEPTRLAIVVESTRDRLLKVVQENADIDRLVRHRWVWLASLDPESGALWEFRGRGFIPRKPEHALSMVVGDSAAWYQGKRGFLPPVAIVQETTSTPDGRPAPTATSA